MISLQDSKTINHLPKEILLKIFYYIVADDILKIKNLNSVCSEWYETCLNNLLWKSINVKNKIVNFDKFLLFSLKHNLYSNLTQLNFCGLCELKHEQIEVIIDNIRNDCLKDLNISNCLKIKSSIFVKIAEKFKNLQSLEIQALIKNEDEFNYDDLVYLFEKINGSLCLLNISENKLDARIFSHLFENCTNLENLDIWNSEIINGTIDLEKFSLKCKKLKFFKGTMLANNYKPIQKLTIDSCFTTLEEFHISVNWNVDDKFYNIINLFCKYSLNLKTLSVTKYKDENGSVQNLFNCINSKILKSIRLNKCTLSSPASYCLGLLIYQCSNTLESLSLSDCQITKFNQIFQNSILKNLIDLNLNRCESVKSEDFKVIGDYCCFLKSLNISLIPNVMEYEDINYLFKRLNENLIDLNISENKLDSRILTSLINNCPNLESLDLWGCDVNSKITINFNELASKCRKLKKLEMIVESDTFEIPKIVVCKYLQNIESFQMRFKNNDMMEEAFIILSMFCKYSLNLKKLTITNYNSYENGSYQGIFDCINPSNLEIIDLRCCTFSNYESAFLIAFIKQCKRTLKELSLHGTSISRLALNELIDCLSTDQAFNLKYFGIKSGEINSAQKEKIRAKMKDIY